MFLAGIIGREHDLVFATSAPESTVTPQDQPACDTSTSRLWLSASVAALVSGLLLAAAFRPLNVHLLAWVAMVPWLLVLPRLRPGGAYLGGFLMALVFYRVGLHWAFAFAGYLAAIVLVVLAIWMGLSF